MVAIRLGQMRRGRKWTQEELADRADVKQSQISAWEGGRRTPDVDSVRKLARAFDMPHDEFAREIGYIDGDGRPKDTGELPPGITGLMREMVRQYPELEGQFAERQGDDDFAAQVRTLARILGFTAREWLDEPED